jgi:hypothetical protein
MLHRRQFVLGPRRFRARPDWETHELSDSLVLSHCPELRIASHGDRVLIGTAVQTAAERPAPADELAQARLAPETWAGRFVLVDGTSLQTDAAGTLGCYVRTTPEGIWASSSLALARSIDPVAPEPTARLTHALGMDWYPPPASGVAGIDRLLPSQLLDLRRGVAPRRPVAQSDTLVYGELLDRIGDRLVAGVTALAAIGAPLWLPLTGGRDSRLLLAAAMAGGVDVTTYTFDGPAMKRGDRELPPRLARAAGYAHVYRQAGPVDRERLELFDRHTDGQTADIDRVFFASGQWDAVPEGALDLGGGVFEIARCYYHPKLPTDTADRAGAVLGALPSVAPDGVRAWADWLAQTPDWVDWRDRLYLEQRSAGWLSAIAQGLDLFGPRRVHLASCSALLGELLSLPEDVRRRGLHHEHLIERLAPALARFPINPQNSTWDRLSGRAHRELEVYRTSGRVDRYARARVRRLRANRAARRLGRAA